jgi:hypothetical protein
VKLSDSIGPSNDAVKLSDSIAPSNDAVKLSNSKTHSYHTVKLSDSDKNYTRPGVTNAHLGDKNVAQPGNKNIAQPGDKNVAQPQPGDTDNVQPGETNDAHPGETNDAHPGETNDAHPGETNDTHPGETNDAHPGETNHAHSGNENSHSGKSAHSVGQEIESMKNYNRDSFENCNGDETKSVKNSNGNESDSVKSSNVNEIESVKNGNEIENESVKNGNEIESESVKNSNEIESKSVNNSNEIENESVNNSNETENESVKNSNEVENEIVKNRNEIENESVKNINEIENESVKNSNELENESVKNSNEIENEGVNNSNEIENESVKNSNEIENESVNNSNETENESVNNSNEVENESVNNSNEIINESVKNNNEIESESVKNSNEIESEGVNNSNEIENESVKNSNETENESVNNSNEIENESVKNSNEIESEGVNNCNEIENESVKNSNETENESVNNSIEIENECVNNRNEIENDSVNNSNEIENNSVNNSNETENESVKNSNENGNKSVKKSREIENESVKNRNEIENKSVKNSNEIENRSVKNGNEIENVSVNNSDEIESESVKKNPKDCKHLSKQVQALEKLCTSLQNQINILNEKLTEKQVGGSTGPCNAPVKSPKSHLGPRTGTYTTISEQVGALHMKPRDVDGNGDCQFSSVAHQMDEDKSAHFYRLAAVDFIRGSRDDFIDPIVGEHSPTFDKTQTPASLSQLKENYDEDYKNAVFDHYLLAMEKSGCCGDHFTLYALACYLKTNIIVHQLNKPPRSMLDSSRENCSMKCINLIYEGRPKEHYQSCEQLSKSHFTPEGLPLKLSKMSSSPHSAFSSILKHSYKPHRYTQKGSNEGWKTQMRSGPRKPEMFKSGISVSNPFSLFQNQENDPEVIEIDDDVEEISTSRRLTHNRHSNQSSQQNRRNHAHEEMQKTRKSQSNKRDLNSCTFDSFCDSFKGHNSQPTVNTQANTETTPTLSSHGLHTSENESNNSTDQVHRSPATERTQSIPEVKQSTPGNAQEPSAAHSKREKPFEKWRTREIVRIPDAKTVVYGDSIVRYISNHADMSTICLPGAKLSNMEKNLKDPEILELLSNAENIILHAGSNDAANQASLEEIQSHLNNLINSVKEMCPNSKITVSGIVLRKPVSLHCTRIINDSLSRMLYLDNIKFIDPNRMFSFKVSDGLARDLIHLNFDGVFELARIFSTAVAPKESGNLERLNLSRKRP